MSNEKAAPEMNVELANYQTRLWEALGEPNTFNFISAVEALTTEVATAKNEMLDSIRASLKDWPNAGCDVEIAQAVEAIVTAEVAALSKRVSILHNSLAKRGAGKPFGDQLEEIVRKWPRSRPRSHGGMPR